ncbi:GA-binding protein subunit beta-2 [Armadillidium vulgare]|nr:GA-binding protein subunit beta-2 [Armadillidium vulgare]
MLKSFLSISRRPLIVRPLCKEGSALFKVSRHYRSFPKDFLKPKKEIQEIVTSPEEEKILTNEIIGKVNKQITSQTHGRLFAVLFVNEKQRMITTEDLLVIREEFAPTAGDKIRMEKVMAVGCSDFTLFGRPLLPKDLVYVEATVVEKTLFATEVMFRYASKKLNFRRPELTVLRISDIRLDYPVNELPSVAGVEGRTF